MIKIGGKEIQNYPEGVKNLNELMLGEINSNVMHNLKTPQYVYGYSTEEILEFAKKVKEADALYDTVYIYDVEDDGIRDFLHQEEIK